MKILIKASGIKERVKALGGPHEPAIRAGFDLIGDDALRITREEAPKKTGALQASIRIKKSRWTWSIVEGAKHGLWVREGAIGHSIFPRKKKALFWPGLSHPVAWAAHPGIRRPNNYPVRAEARITQSSSNRLSVIGQDIAITMGK